MSFFNDGLGALYGVFALVLGLMIALVAVLYSIIMLIRKNYKKALVIFCLSIGVLLIGSFSCFLDSVCMSGPGFIAESLLIIGIIPAVAVTFFPINIIIAITGVVLLVLHIVRAIRNKSNSVSLGDSATDTSVPNPE